MRRSHYQQDGPQARGYNMQLVVETEITCPHCGEVFPLQIDTSQPEQSLIEDCTVCCRPMNITVRCQPGSIVDLVCEA